MPPRLPPRPRLPPLSREEWESYREIDGRISKENEEKFRARVFAGVSPSPPPLSLSLSLSLHMYMYIHVHHQNDPFSLIFLSQSIDHSIRREVWKYLLGYFRFDATDIERMEEQKAKEKEYEIMKKQWESFLPQQETNFARWRELRNLVGETKKNNFMLLHCTLFYAEKDVIRTDRDVELFHSVSSPQLKQLQSILKTYIMYNMDLGKDPMYMYV